MSLAHRFLQTLGRDSERVLLEGDTGVHRRREVRDLALRVAARLQGAGVRPGDRVALSLPKTEWLPACHVGALAAGAVVLPINPALPDAEIASLLERSGAVLAISGSALAARAGAVSPGLPWWCAGEEAPAGVQRLDPEGEPLRAPVERRPGDLALLVFTSGTTGRPKGVPLSHENVLSNLDALARVWEWTEEDRLLHVLPVFHLHGLGVALYGSLRTGNAILLEERFEAEAVLRAAERRRATLLMAVPTMLHRLVEAAGPDGGRALSGLRLVVSGSAPLPPALFARFRDRFGLAPVERYGMTETLMIASNPARGPRKAGSVGWPLPGVELRLAGGDAGEDAGRGPGEVCVRGPSVFRGYWQDEEATRAAFDSEGWLHTGDVGTLDADGALRLVGRRKELIVTGGYNVAPAAVEEALDGEGDPRIAELAVAGVPDEDLGERVVAFVVLAGRREGRAQVEAELRERAAARLPRYAQPRAYRWVEGIPRNALGKVQRSLLTGVQGEGPGA